jgi:transcription elongation factor Elf1
MNGVQWEVLKALPQKEIANRFMPMAKSWVTDNTGECINCGHDCVEQHGIDTDYDAYAVTCACPKCGIEFYVEYRLTYMEIDKDAKILFSATEEDIEAWEKPPTPPKFILNVLW